MPSGSNFFLVLLSIATTAICWGAYGPVLHNGQSAMQNGRLRPFICVGIAYFLIAIVVPILLIVVTKMEADKGWSFSGTVWSLAAGIAGAVGALGIIMAFTYGGTPSFVTPLVFGFAPIINVATTVYLGKLAGKEYDFANPALFMAGIILVALGASTVLYFAPKPKGGPHGKPKIEKPVVTEESKPAAPAAEKTPEKPEPAVEKPAESKSEAAPSESKSEENKTPDKS